MVSLLLGWLVGKVLDGLLTLLRYAFRRISSAIGAYSLVKTKELEDLRAKADTLRLLKSTMDDSERLSLGDSEARSVKK